MRHQKTQGPEQPEKTRQDNHEIQALDFFNAPQHRRPIHLSSPFLLFLHTYILHQTPQLFSSKFKFKFKNHTIIFTIPDFGFDYQAQLQAAIVSNHSNGQRHFRSGQTTRHYHHTQLAPQPDCALSLSIQRRTPHFHQGNPYPSESNHPKSTAPIAGHHILHSGVQGSAKEFRPSSWPRRRCGRGVSRH